MFALRLSVIGGVYVMRVGGCGVCDRLAASGGYSEVEGGARRRDNRSQFGVACVVSTELNVILFENLRTLKITYPFMLIGQRLAYPIG